jgi:hypothetical protein
MIARATPSEEQPDPSQAQAAPSEPSPLEPLLSNLAALRSYAEHYLSARVDALKHRVRGAVLALVLGALGLLAAAAALVTAVVLTLRGVAAGLTALLGGRGWAGDLLTGAGILIGTGLGVYFLVRGWIGSSRRKMVHKYERQREHERDAVGRDVRERASAGSAPF